MLIWQQIIIFTFAFLGLIGFIKGWRQTSHKKNPFGLTPFFNLLGAYVGADLVVFGPFWFLVSLLSFILQDWLLFCLIFSFFWLMRSIGETIYWLLEQFVSQKKNKTEDLPLHRIFPGESVYVAYQIFNQCLTVIFAILSVYLIKLWLA